MSPRIILLLTLYCVADSTLMRVVLEIDDMNKLPPGVLEFPLEPESRDYLMNLLPPHIRKIGPLVEVGGCFDAVRVAAQTQGENESNTAGIPGRK